MRVEHQLASANDMQCRLERQLEKLRSDAAQADSTSHQVAVFKIFLKNSAAKAVIFQQMGAETTRLADDLRTLEQKLAKEKETVRGLESLVTLLRQERVQQESHLRNMSQDLTRLQHRETILQEEL